MRAASLLLSSLVLAGRAFAAASPSPSPARAAAGDDSASASDGDTAVEIAQPSTYNNYEVPPMTNLTSKTFDDAVRSGFWFVKYYSPYCPFCVAIAPTWQTLYERYYTSLPEAAADDEDEAKEERKWMTTFTSYYDVHFAAVNCVENGDKCLQQGITMWPTFVLYNNSKVVTTFEGAKDMQGMAAWVEEQLEAIRPGSRPAAAKTAELPKPGATNGVPLTYIVTPAKSLPPGGKILPPPPQPSAHEHDHDHEHEQVDATSDGRSSPVYSMLEDLTVSNTTRTPNERGVSVPLTAETFQRLVTMTSDLWFVKFYAPWCPHCQAMAASWHHMAKAMQGKLNVGEVNCDEERLLCKDARIGSYPTIQFFRGGEKVEYNGLRGYGDLLQVAESAVDIVGYGITDVDEEAFDRLVETNRVLFLYFYDHATTSEDFRAMNRLTLSLVNHAKLVKTNDAALARRFRIGTFPRLMCYREGKTNYYAPLTPKEMRDVKGLLKWMRGVWLPLVPELTVANAAEILGKKYAVLGILNRQRGDEFAQDTRELKNAALEWMEKQTKLFQIERQELRDAKQLRIEEAEDRNDQRALRAAKGVHINIREDDRKQVAFAWVDGVFWQRWLKTTYGIDIRGDGGAEGGSDGGGGGGGGGGSSGGSNGGSNSGLATERVIIADEENNRYWDTTSSGAPIMPSRTSILETLSHIVNSPEKLRAKSTVGPVRGTVLAVRTFVARHPALVLFTLAVAMLFLAVSMRGGMRRAGRGSPARANAALNGW
ncbi:hypothetical protein KEM52_006614 [Ascosphaera acerosa]|nr:hypothetical protein KEM52_006614 [Ascosphaera acerosa]